MSDKTGRLIAFGLFSIAAAIAVAAVVYAQATPRFQQLVGLGKDFDAWHLLDLRTGATFNIDTPRGVTGPGPKQIKWRREFPEVGCEAGSFDCEDE